jgi:photosystem II stability/assembly factor-like uncharacterized protein
LLTARNKAYLQKLRLIDKFGRRSGWKAGYDPAGAGSPWYSIGPRNINGRVKSIAVHPTDPDIVYAGAACGGVWKSTDGGQTWNALWDEQESLAIGALGIAASAPNTIYAGTGEWTPGYGTGSFIAAGQVSYPGAGVYVSTDAGITWTQKTAVKCRRIGKLVVDSTNPMRLLVCGDQGLELSVDGGDTWTTLRTDMVTDLVLDPLNSQTVFIGVSGSGFYKSIDGGTTFNLLPGAPTGNAVSWPQVAIGTSGPHTNKFIVIRLADTVQTSIDGGSTFTVVPGSHPRGYFLGWNDVIACAPDDEQLIFWGGVGLDRTANGGTLWTALPVHDDQHALVFAPSNSSILYIIDDGGVWRSEDKGATVEQVSNGLVITQFYNLNFWSPLSNVLGGGSQDTGVAYTTSGLTWNSVYGRDGGWVVFDPTDPRTMYIESQSGDIEKTTAGGPPWTYVAGGTGGTTPWEGILTMDPSDHLRLYAGTDRVYITTDGCATAWTQSSQVLNGEISAIAVAAQFSNRVYVGTGPGNLYRSDDSGSTSPWLEITGTLPGRAITSVTATTSLIGVVMVSIGGLSVTASSQSVYRSVDGGSTWTNVSGDLPKVVGNAIAIDPSSDNIWYLATDTGVFKTTNAGINWLPFDNGIPNAVCSDLVVDSTSKILYCATLGRGAYKLDITPGVAKSAVDVYIRDNDLDTGERFPSPSGLPDPLLPAPGLAFWYMSPDIKVNHAPFFVPDGVFDGVIFDATLVHQDPYRGQSNRFYIQVHNRGWKSTSNVSVRAFVADASAGLPNLPNSLAPPDFNVGAGAWQPVGVAQTISLLEPNRPVVVYWDYTLPMTAATHTCCLAVVSSPDDPFNDSSTIISQLVPSDKRVCLKNLHIVDPPPGPMRKTMTAIDFVNVSSRSAVMDIQMTPVGFANGTIGLLLPKVTFADTENESTGVDIIPLRLDDPIGSWYTNEDAELERLLAARLAACDRTHLYEFDSTKVSELRGLNLAANETLHGIIVTSLENDVSVTGPARLYVTQFEGRLIGGGSMFQFGYDLPPVGTLPQPIRLQITSDCLMWTGCGHHKLCCTLVVRITVADDPNRAYDHVLWDIRRETKPGTVFDGILMNGDSLTITVLEKHVGGMENLYQHRFDGRVRSWLGKHEARGKDRLVFFYDIEQVSAAAAPGGD